MAEIKSGLLDSEDGMAFDVLLFAPRRRRSTLRRRGLDSECGCSFRVTGVLFLAFTGSDSVGDEDLVTAVGIVIVVAVIIVVAVVIVVVVVIVITL